MSCENSSDSLHSDQNILRISINRELTTLDPRKNGEIASSSIQFLIFEGLMRLDPHNRIVPAQAKSVKISEDGLTYTFYLRNAQWSDGTEVTAYDFEYAWKTLLKPDFPSPNAHLFYPIKYAEAAKKGEVEVDKIGIEAKDKRTLVVQLEKPIPYFLDLVSFCAFFPIHSQSAKNTDKNKEFKDIPIITNGPFELARWKYQDKIILKKNKHYWENKRVKLEAIHISIIQDPMTTFHLYTNGELDMVESLLSPVPVDSFLELSKTDSLKTNPSAGTMIVAFNTEQFPFSNKYLRKAFAYAINRQTIVKNITQLNETAALNALPLIFQEETPFFQDEDIARAKLCFQKGLAELQIKPSDLETLTYSYAAEERNHKIAQVLQEQWHHVLGVKIQLQPLEHRILLDHLNKRTFTCAQTFYFAQFQDQTSILERFKYSKNLKNYTGWENEDFIFFIEKAAAERDLIKRLKWFGKAETILMEEMPFSPIFHCTATVVFKPYLKDVYFSPIGTPLFDKIRIDRSKKEE